MSFKHTMGIFVLMFVLLPGCSSVWAESLPRIPEASARMIDMTVRGRNNTLPQPINTITLQEAVLRTMQHNPELAAAAWETSAQEAVISQAGLRPNPEIELVSEEFGGTASRQRFEGAEMSLRLSQVIELGGKRTQRKQTALIDHALAQWDFEIKRLDTLTQLTKSFIELLAAQERLSLIQKSEKLAEQFYDMVVEKVKAGQVPPLEESRAQVALAAERLKRQQAERPLQIARKQTAAFWGESDPTFEFASGNLDSILPVPRIDNPEQLVVKNPELNRWSVELELHYALLDMERSNSIPDIAISGGVSRFNADRENALIMGLSIPFPIFNRNQGNIRKAERQLSMVREEQHAEAVRVRKSLFVQYQTLAAAYEQASILAHEVIPVAQSALTIAEEGYHAGKFSYLNVLDAQRSLFEVQEQNIEALASYHSTAAEMERLTGAPLEDFILKSQ